ncbi:unnamed protein product [Phaedon cochleariae]|uniref:Double jelly roll-like domain-containing protein n=1 Tax=Phaedon cochleariae TaxID=80249 RepID=A0A9N9S8S3_PHACE|nr:unnamed protein product [Phaedon cochleariae]
MLSSQVFNIFRKPHVDESIQKVEWRTYYPYVKSFRNNDVIEININQSDAFNALYESILHISGKVTRTEGAGHVAFVNNAGAYMFQSISYDQNGKELESVRDFGTVRTVRGYLCYSAEDTEQLAIARWTYPNNVDVMNAASLAFSMFIPLKHLLNIVNDYECVSYGKHSIRLVRAENDNNCFKITENAVGTAVVPTKLQLEIKNVELEVKRLFPNDQIKLHFLKAIKADTPILIPFRKWELHMLPSLTTGATNGIWAVKTFSFLLAFDEGAFPQAYFNYTQFGYSYKNTFQHTPLLGYPEFANIQPLFVIDCSRRYGSVKSSTVDVKLEIEASQEFSANTRAYCIIIHDNIIEHLPLSDQAGTSNSNTGPNLEVTNIENPFARRSSVARAPPRPRTTSLPDSASQEVFENLRSDDTAEERRYKRKKMEKTPDKAKAESEKTPDEAKAEEKTACAFKRIMEKMLKQIKSLEKIAKEAYKPKLELKEGISRLAMHAAQLQSKEMKEWLDEATNSTKEQEIQQAMLRERYNFNNQLQHMEEEHEKELGELHGEVQEGTEDRIVYQSLRTAKMYMLEHNKTKLASPQVEGTIGTTLVRMLEFLYADTNVEITVYMGNEGQENTNSRMGRKLLVKVDETPYQVEKTSKREGRSRHRRQFL